MTKKVILVCVICMVILLLGCSKRETVEQNIDYANRDEVIINYKYWCEKQEHSQLMLSIIENFNRTNNKKIRVVGEEIVLDDSYNEELLSGLKENTDVVSIDLSMIKKLADNKFITNLEPFIKKLQNKKDVNNNIYKIIEKESGKKKFYAMPWYANTWYVYFRPSYFENAGVDVPKNFNEFLECCKNSGYDFDKDGISDLHSISFAGKNDLAKICGSFLASENGSFEKIKSNNSIKGMEKFLEFCKSNYVLPSYMSDGNNEVIQNFKNGFTSMVILKHGNASDFILNFNNDVSAFAIPKGKGQWTYVDNVGNVIFENCKNKNDAFVWITYLTTGEGQRMWCEGTGNISIDNKLLDDESFTNDLFTKVGLESLNFAGNIDWMKEEDFNNRFSSIIALGINGELSANDVCNKLYDEFNK